MTKSASTMLLASLLVSVSAGCGDKGCPKEVLDRCYAVREECAAHLPDAGDEMDCEYEFCHCLSAFGCEDEAKDHCDG